MKKISAVAAVGISLLILGVAAAFAWFFLRKSVKVEHTVTVPEDEVTVKYQPVGPDKGVDFQRGVDEP